MNMDRSLAFTALLEWDEFGRLDARIGERVTTELVEYYRANPTVTMWDAYLTYRAAIGDGNLTAHANTLEDR